MNSIGSRLKERRNELKLTQMQIKEMTGISSGNLSDIEHDKIMPSALALISLSSALKCSIDWILTGKSLDNENPFFSPDESKFISYYKQLGCDDREEILILMEAKIKRLKKEKLSNSFLANENMA